MSNNLLNNTSSLRNILEALQNKATPSGVDTTDATAIAEDIMLNKTAYVKGEKITGIFTLEEELTDQEDIITQLENAIVGKAIGGGGEVDHSIEDSLVTGIVSAYANDRITEIKAYAFYFCTNLTSVSFPICTVIGSSAFYSCASLTSISFPICTFVGESAF